MTSPSPWLYPARRVYLLLVLLGLAVAALFVREVARGQGFDQAVAVFLLLSALGFAGIHGMWALTRVELTPTGLTVHRPGRPPLHVDFRQMVDVHEGGRLLKTLSLVYYPVDADGLVDLEAPRSLFLPAVERQAELLRVLRSRLVE